MNEKAAVHKGLKLADVTLSYYAVIPDHPRALLIIVHGLSEHSGRYRKLQEELAEDEFASWAYDQRGFGKSTGDRTYVADYNDFLSDLKHVIAMVKQTYPALPLVIIGHSLGGLVAATFCAKQASEANGLILSALAYDVYPLPRMLRFLAMALNRLCPKRLIRYPSTGENLSHDPEIVRAFRADPLVQSAGTPRFYHEFFKMNRYLHNHADQIRLPTLILQGTDDTTVFPEGAQRLHDAIQSEKKHLIFYDRFYHEPFNEIGRERVLSDMIGWLNTLISDSREGIIPKKR